jgi:nucleoside-diphosphate-sugar epimerase
MTPTRILVTGASGFVGGRFLSRFRDRPGLVLHGVGRRALDDPDYTALDLAERFGLPFKPDVVIHAAARASPWGTAAEYRRDNVEATRNVIDFCRRCPRPPRLIYVSSSSVFYRRGPQLGLTEESPIGPRFVNRYAATKYEGERLVREYPGPWLILRPRAVFGPGDTVLFPRLLAAARAGRLPLFTADPPAVGDLIYIDTLADYLLRAVERPELTGAYNLTNAEPVAIQPFLLDVFARLGLPAPRRRVSVRTAFWAAGLSEAAWALLRLSGEPPVTRFGVGVFAWSKTFDVRRALADLGPPSVPLADGVEAFVRWVRQQGET